MTLTDASYQSQGAEAPEPPDFEVTHAYYEGPPGTPCPVCRGPKPFHDRGCWEAPDYGPSYRSTPADYEPGGRYA